MHLNPSDFCLPPSKLDKLRIEVGFHDLFNIECYEEKCDNLSVYNSSELCYESFLKKHMLQNVPCVIKRITSDWGSLSWVRDNKPNFQLLQDKFGSTLVPVANCGDRYYNAQKKEQQTMKQFLDYWKSYILNKYPSQFPCYYLKDWHCMRDFPDENIYKVPLYFGSDWLNEYFTAREDLKDDYRFVYMGPKGSWTPFHADVFSSYSWSVNICGKKRWILFPPGEEKYLKDKNGTLVYDIESPSLLDATQYQGYHKLSRQYEVIQEAGDAIFVPSGWHHQVWNLDDTISINHNWVNGFNIDKMWTSMRMNLDLVKKEISDCHDMEGWDQHCQLMLNASYGMDFKQFCKFLIYIVRVRIEHLKEKKELKLFNSLTLGFSHMKLDIFQAKKILCNVISDPDFTKLKYSIENCEIMEAIKEIDIILDE